MIRYRTRLRFDKTTMTNLVVILTTQILNNNYKWLFRFFFTNNDVQLFTRRKYYIK